MPDDPLWDDLTPEEQKLYAEHANVHKLDPAKRRKKPPQAEVVDELATARMFVEQNKNRFKYNHDRKRWLVWIRQHWREDGKQTVVRLVGELCRSLEDKAAQKVRFVEAVERFLRSTEDFATVSADWDQDPMMLGTPGGIVDLESGEMRPGLPQDMISKTVAVAPAAAANCPRWLAFIDEALGGKTDNIRFFQRFCGYALTGSTKEEMLLFIAGKPGTGKGTATKTVISILRDYSLAVPPTMFVDVNNRALEYYRAALVGARLVLASEPEKGAVWGDAFVNELTGGDRISARNPAGLVFNFDPAFKLAFQGEQVPDLKAVSTGLKRRLGLLPFDHSPATPDPNLKEALKAEYPGILRWMIDGCLEWQTIGLGPPPDVRAAVEEYFASQDVVGRWIEDCCTTGPTLREPPKTLLGSYNAWADVNYEKGMSYKSLMPVLRNKKFDVRPIGGKNYVHGIAVRPEDPPDNRYEPHDIQETDF